VPDVDFIKKTVTSSTCWTIKTLSENIVLIDIASVSLIPVLLGFYSFIADAIGFGIIKFGPEICSVVKSKQ
jgi:hypothetical protein